MRNIANRLQSWQPRPYLLVLLTLLLFMLSACTSNSGLFSGGQWQASSLQNQHLQVLAVDPNHLKNLYAGDAQNGIFLSTDAGVTWKQSSAGLPLPLAVTALSFDIPGQKLYAATSLGLYASSNAGTTWSLVANLPADSYTTLAFNANAPHTVYTGTERSGVFKSSDDGIHWVHLNNGLPDHAVTSLLYDPNLKQLWVAFADAVYRSDDDGAHWQTMSNGIPANADIRSLALGGSTTSNPNLIFAGTAHGFYRSTDAGQHWVQSQLSLVNIQISVVLSDATQSNIVYISTNIGVLRSQDYGQNWDQLAAGLPNHQTVTSLVQGNTSDAQLFATSHGIYIFPGNGGVAGSGQLVQILVVLLFFAFLYWFFIQRRRRPVPALRRHTGREQEPASSTPEQEV